MKLKVYVDKIQGHKLQPLVDISRSVTITPDNVMEIHVVVVELADEITIGEISETVDEIFNTNSFEEVKTDGFDLVLDVSSRLYRQVSREKA